MNNIVGQKFNRLTAIEIVGKYGYENVWKFKCDCGNIINRRSFSIINGHTKSCGCLASEITKRVHSLPRGEAGFNIILRDYKYRSKNKNIEFELNIDEFYELITGNCFYCGASPNQIRETPTKNDRFIYNGIDRLDNSRGYIINNCVSCCKKCNTMKGSLNFGEFKMLIQTIYLNLEKQYNEQ